ncbi:hypothetical protein ABL78_6010 [Leptomonas seymouri]|uniref:Integral membrane bound transporter domain-containing protein n=1 Tax=Leptomonas seymouri TaxID=5684 RepID=A0A0N1I403_LEPSE|nr:hypothetical protein ABL78_6010 [Leptomonas seymouri]|eukprot:KPI84943.1 hypothetical protein ABL78_6010 [Leptomonas seymouri]
MDETSDLQQSPGDVPDPSTKAAHGNSGSSTSSPAPHCGDDTLPAHAAEISPNSIEVANRRFNETAPPVLSPMSSSLQHAGLPTFSLPVAIKSSSPTSSGALASNGHAVHRDQQVRHYTPVDADGSPNYLQDSSQRADPQRGRGHKHGESAHERRRGRHSGRRRSSPTSSRHAHEPSHITRSGQAARHHHQHAQRRHPVAAAPQLDHGVVPGPTPPALGDASTSRTLPTADDTNGHHLHILVADNNKASAPKEAAVPGFELPVDVGDAGGGVQGGRSAGPDHLSEHASTNSGSDADASTTAAAYKGREVDNGLRNTGVTHNNASSLMKPSSHFDEGQSKVFASSGTLDDEGALLPQHHGRQVHIPHSGPSDESSGAVLRRKASSGHTGSRTHRSHDHPRRLGAGVRNHQSHSRNKAKRANYGHSAQSYMSDPPESAATHISYDSFGFPAYHPIYRHSVFGEYDTLHRSRPGGTTKATAAGGGGGGGAPPGASLEVPTTTSVPWDLRNISETQVNKSFVFLSTRYFWFLVEFAMRVTFIAMMIPAIIINLNLPHTPFKSATFALTSVVIAVGTNFGQSCVFFVQYVKGGCIWLPLATICYALKLGRHLGAWFVVYVVVLFLMAMFTDRTARRLCLLLYNISMVSLLSGNESLAFPSRVLADWAIGAAFALVATLIPYPMLASRLSARITEKMFRNTATCFTGILSCFWAPSNTERSMSMVRIRSLVRTLDHLIDKFDAHDAFTFYEVLIYETSERRELRKEKVKLLLNLKMNLRAMERVINMVQEKPQMIDMSDRCVLLREHLSAPMDDISRSMEALLWALSEAKTYDQLRTLSGYFEAAGRAIKRLQTEFDVGRRVLLYEHEEVLHDGRMEEFVPLMTFFVFSIVNFWSTLEEFGTFIHRHKATSNVKGSLKLIWNALIDPFVENAELIRLLCVRRAEPEVRVVIEAAKVSVAMLISVIFFYYVDNQSLLLTGPSIIAFVSGTNPVEAVQAGAARLSGTLIGAVLGFFAASLCRTAVDRVIALCVITFVMTFFRPGQKFGAICMYCNFVAVSGLAPIEQTADETISRIQQNTFAIFIYCFISVSVFPVSPNELLSKKRMMVMRSLNSTLQKLASLFQDASRSYTEARAAVLHGAKTEDDVVSIGHSEITQNRMDPMCLRSNSLVPIGHDNSNNSGMAIVKLKDFDNSEMGMPASRSNSNVIMPGVFTMAPQDTLVESIFVDIFAMMDTMKATTSIMPLAADEFRIIPREYPLRASGDVHAALHRLSALIYTMTCAWKTMREKGYFTMDMLHILHNLAPIAMDIAHCLDRFTHVMEFYVRFPSSGLSSELTKGAMQFRVLCLELSVRKERDLMEIIRQTILLKRVRGNHSVATRDTDQSGEGGKSGNGGDHNGGNGSGGGAHAPKRRSRHEERNSRSSRSRRRWKRSRGSSRHKGSQRCSSLHCRAAPSGSSSCRHRSSPSHQTTHSDVAGLGEHAQSRVKDPFSHTQRPTTAAFYSAPANQERTQPASDSSSSVTTFKDSVMPRVDSRDQALSRITAPIPDDPTWLPVPFSELPEMPSHHQQQQQAQQRHMDPHQHPPARDADSLTSAPPQSRVDGGGAVTNTTCIFDPSVFPPPPMQGASIEETTNALRDSASAPAQPSSSPLGSLPPQLRGRRGGGGDGDGSHQRYPHSPPHVQQQQHHHHHHRSSRHAPRLFAHEESPPSKISSVLQRANRLRENFRGAQHHAAAVGMTRRHSSCEMRTFGPSYTGSASIDGAAAMTPYSLAHNHPSHPRSHFLHFPRRHGRTPHLQCASTSSPGLDGRLPYGSREDDPAFLDPPTEGEGAYRPDSSSSKDPHMAKGIRRNGPQQQQQLSKEVPFSRGKGKSGGTKHCSQDRITLKQSSSDDDGHRIGYSSGGASLYSSSYSDSSYEGDSSGYSSSDGSDSYMDGGASRSSSLVRYNDSFMTPITVQDAEGLHAFSLSLEMFAKELRRALYGLEEMLQSV